MVYPWIGKFLFERL